MPSPQSAIATTHRSIRKTEKQTPSIIMEYTGKLTKTGNSTGFRFEAALFKSHPEFDGEVRARIIAPGRLLVTAEPAETRRADPVIESFLAFLQQDMVNNPRHIRLLDKARSARTKSLVKGVPVNDAEDLSEESLLG